MELKGEECGPGFKAAFRPATGAPHTASTQRREWWNKLRFCMFPNINVGEDLS